MIPEEPTFDNVKPVLAAMIPSLVYNMKPHQGADRKEAFQWADKILEELTNAQAKGKVTTFDLEGGKGTITCIINDTTSATMFNDPGKSNKRDDTWRALPDDQL